jgi:hypothetical protein
LQPVRLQAQAQGQRAVALPVPVPVPVQTIVADGVVAADAAVRAAEEASSDQAIKESPSGIRLLRNSLEMAE